MSRLKRFLFSARSALMVSAFVVVLGTAGWLYERVSAGARNVDWDPGPWSIVGALGGVVLATYLGLAALGYRVTGSGDVKAPRIVTRLVAAVATVIVLGAVVAAVVSR